MNSFSFNIPFRVERRAKPKTAYIETDGEASYMNIGIAPDPGTAFEVDCMFVSGSGTTILQNAVFGSAFTNLTASTSHTLFYRPSDGYLRFAKPTSNAFKELLPGTRNLIRIEPGASGGTDITVGSHTESISATYTATVSMKFGCSYSNDKKFYSRSRFYGARFWQDGELVRDLVPYSGPRGVGMLDKVNDVLYDNRGGGTLEYVEED